MLMIIIIKKKLNKKLKIHNQEKKDDKVDKKIDINSEKEITYDKEIKIEINNNSDIINQNIQKNFEEKNNIFKQEIKYNEHNNNIDISFDKEQNDEKKDIKKDKTFPKGTKYEEELNSNFKYFNIFWYDPNKSNDFDNFKKCFENVQFNKAYDIDSIKKFFKNEYISEWIVITPGSKGEELINNLDNIKCIKYFFIYCKNPKLHESWASSYKKVGCVTSNPEILCQKLIELNNKYRLPNFNYQSKSNNEIESKINSDYIFKINSQKLKEIIQAKNATKNSYNNLCFKILNYLGKDNIMNDFIEANMENNSPFNLFAIFSHQIGKGVMEQVINNLKNLTLLSLYFSKYPYIFNLLSAEEVNALFITK